MPWSMLWLFLVWYYDRHDQLHQGSYPANCVTKMLWLRKRLARLGCSLVSRVAKKWVCILWDEKSEKNPGIPKEHTCFIFHKLMDFFGMVDTTVVEHKHTAWSRVWVGEWQLRFCQILSKSPEYSHAPQVHTRTLQIAHSSLTLQLCHVQWYHPRWWLERSRTSSP